MTTWFINHIKWRKSVANPEKYLNDVKKLIKHCIQQCPHQVFKILKWCIIIYDLELLLLKLIHFIVQIDDHDNNNNNDNNIMIYNHIDDIIKYMNYQNIFPFY